jgi:glutathione S-transferase
MKNSPNQLFPYIIHNDKQIADSTEIIRYLQSNFNNTLDSNLTAEQQAQSIALQRICDHHLYWTILYYNWVDPEGWLSTEEAFFAAVPKLLRKWVANKVRKHQLQRLQQQSLGRLSPTQIYHQASEDIDTIATYLDKKQYLLGDSVHAVDATVHAFLAVILRRPGNSPLKQHVAKYPELEAYVSRIFQRFYDEEN